MPFRIVRNDITKMQVDAIVNTANKKPVFSFGTDLAVYEAAGAEELLAARKKIGELSEGEVAITPGFKLPAKYIIHAVSPVYMGGAADEADKLRSCYEKSLKLALEYGCESIAFPLIATGSFGYPKAEALEIALAVIHSFLMNEDMMVYLVVFDNESVRLSGQIFADIEAFIDEHYVEEKAREEYFPVSDELCECSMRLELDACEDAKEHGATCESVMLDEAWRDESLKEIRSSAPLASNSIAAVVLTADVHEKRVKSAKKKFVTSADAMLPPALAAKPVAPAQRVEMVAAKSAAKDSKRTLEELMNNVGETFQQRLFRLIDERGRTDVDVYKGACKDKKFFYKIRNNVNYQPTKHTVFAFALSLRLSLDETKDLLASAGFALSPSSRFDLIMQYVIEHEIYDMYKIDCILYDLGEEHFFSCA